MGRPQISGALSRGAHRSTSILVSWATDACERHRSQPVPAAKELE
jgi:hypothetical protein